MTTAPHAPAAQDVTVSRPDKVIFPGAGLTKADLADYYRRMAPTILPHLRGRAITLRRFPDGIGSEGFFQKNTPAHFPDWIRRASLGKEGGMVDYLLLDTDAALVYVADQGAVELHAALGPAGSSDRPDQMILDLDPSDDDFGKVQDAARHLQKWFSSNGLPAFVKTTGSRGLHVTVPLDPSENGSFDESRMCARRIAEEIAHKAPSLATTAMRKKERGDRVFIDYVRNAYGQTAVAPYSLRARPDASVATPLDWTEALASDMRPARYTLKTIFRRLAQRADPWADIRKDAIALSRLREKL